MTANERASFLLAASVLLTLTGCKEQKAKVADLPNQPDRWVDAISLQADTKATHVGKTSAILGATEVKSIAISSVAVGSKVDGVPIGAIKCTFFTKDSTYSNEQFMWRGRWGCQAGRNRNEVSNAVADDGTKRFDYIYVSPVNLAAQP